MHRTKKSAGFSLVELSIVLVILGLLTGGILAGKSLIRAAEVRSVISEGNRYRTAMYAFRDKYFQLPGDFRDASSFWGPADTNDGFGVDCRTALRLLTSQGTCNGDGNGLIDDGSSGNLVEQYMVWNHLAYAGLVEGRFYYTTAFNNMLPGVHFPGSKVSSSAGWNACYTDHGNYGRGSAHMLVLGVPGWSATPCSMGNSSGMSAPEVWGVDNKIDDGKADTGRVTALNSYDGQTNCVSLNFPGYNLPADYVLTQTRPSCRLFWRIDL